LHIFGISYIFVHDERLVSYLFKFKEQLNDKIHYREHFKRRIIQNFRWSNNKDSLLICIGYISFFKWDYLAMKKVILIMSLSFLLMGCSYIPPGIQAVEDFEIEKYLGTWYEIARLDHSFERGLNNVSATYTIREDGGIDVLNKGFDEKNGQWKQAKGKAYFVKDKSIGQLKVTFFWPFYGGYNVISLDKEKYSYALVCGPKRSYLWILAREKKLDNSIRDNLLETAKKLGFKTEELIFVKQDL